MHILIENWKKMINFSNQSEFRKKFILFFLIVFAFFKPIYIFTEEISDSNAESLANQSSFPSIEGKVGYFFFTDSTISEVYSSGGIDVQLAGSYPIWKFVSIYGAVEFFEKNGHSSSYNDRTWVYGIPLSLGVKADFDLKANTNVYAAFGPRYSFIQSRANSSFVPYEANSGGIGLFALGGLYFTIQPHYLLNLFGEYSYIPVYFKTVPTNVYGAQVDAGGFTFGGGLSYSF
jgi:hypothetical protein